MATYDYEDYQSLIESKKEIQNYYATAKSLKDEIEAGGLAHQQARGYLALGITHVGEGSVHWTGPDAESYRYTAQEICDNLKKAEAMYIQGLQEIMDYCDKESARYSEWILKVKENMGVDDKLAHFWNAGVLGKMDG